MYASAARTTIPISRNGRPARACSTMRRAISSHFALDSPAPHDRHAGDGRDFGLRSTVVRRSRGAARRDRPRRSSVSRPRAGPAPPAPAARDRAAREIRPARSSAMPPAALLRDALRRDLQPPRAQHASRDARARDRPRDTPPGRRRPAAHRAGTPPSRALSHPADENSATVRASDAQKPGRLTTRANSGRSTRRAASSTIRYSTASDTCRTSRVRASTKPSASGRAPPEHEALAREPVLQVLRHASRWAQAAARRPAPTAAPPETPRASPRSSPTPPDPSKCA